MLRRFVVTLEVYIRNTERPSAEPFPKWDNLCDIERFDTVQLYLGSGDKRNLATGIRDPQTCGTRCCDMRLSDMTFSDIGAYETATSDMRHCDEIHKHGHTNYVHNDAELEII